MGEGRTGRATSAVARGSHSRGSWRRQRRAGGGFGRDQGVRTGDEGRWDRGQTLPEGSTGGQKWSGGSDIGTGGEKGEEGEKEGEKEVRKRRRV